MKRFYSAVETDGAQVLLDGRPLKTKRAQAFVAPTAAIAEAIAQEWRAQGERIDLASMLMTKMVSTAIDLVEPDPSAWRSAILVYLVADLLCYRAQEPEALIARQTAAWDPVLDWASRDLGVSLVATAGVNHVGQPSASIRAGEDALLRADPHELTALRATADATGSAVIALALWKRAFPAQTLFSASRVDETFQRERWGEDAEATAREANLRAHFDAAALYFDLLRDV